MMITTEQNSKTEGTLGKITESIDEAFDVERLPFRRNLTQEEIQKLRAAVSLGFSEDIHAQVIEKLMHYCYYVERSMKGRAAGNIEDLIIRYLLRYWASLLAASTGKNRIHLEIGALFGAATIFSCHAVKLAGKNLVTGVIDPFAGFYGGDADVVSKLKVEEETFWSNIKHLGFNEDNVMVFKGLSTDKEIIERCKEFKILSLIIDGDHTYEGVKNDWFNYSEQIVPGGYVLFDDYNSVFWPEVTLFVNREVLSRMAGRWEVVLAYGNSLIVRRTDYSGGNGSEYTEKMFQELKGAERIIERQKETIERIDKQLQAVHNSLSWKITAPLRQLGRPIRERKGKKERGCN